MNWYYKDGDKEIGPVADEAMKALIEAGVVNASSLVKQDGTTEWVSLSESGLSGINPRSACPSSTLTEKNVPARKRMAFIFVGAGLLAAAVIALCFKTGILSISYQSLNHASQDQTSPEYFKQRYDEEAQKQQVLTNRLNLVQQQIKTRDLLRTVELEENRLKSTNMLPVTASGTYPNQFAGQDNFGNQKSVCDSINQHFNAVTLPTSAGQDNFGNQRSVYDSINQHYNAVTLPTSAAKAMPLEYKPRPVTP
jgi:hypothetical protein